MLNLLLCAILCGHPATQSAAPTTMTIHVVSVNPWTLSSLEAELTDRSDWNAAMGEALLTSPDVMEILYWRESAAALQAGNAQEWNFSYAPLYSISNQSNSSDCPLPEITVDPRLDAFTVSWLINRFELVDAVYPDPRLHSATFKVTTSREAVLWDRSLRMPDGRMLVLILKPDVHSTS